MKISLLNQFMLISILLIGTHSTAFVQAEKNEELIAIAKRIEESKKQEETNTTELQPKLSSFGDDQALQKLKYGRICFFDTRGSSPFVRILENDMAKVTTFQLKKNLDKIQVVRQWIHNYGDWLRTDKAYKGKAKSYIGKALEALVNSHYKDKILVDQYKTGYPFCLKLNTMKELSTIIKYLMEDGVLPNTTKNTLFVTTEEPFDVTQLTQGEINFINKYFTMQDALNDEASLALCKSLKATLELCADVNNFHGLVTLYGNQSETVVALLNKEFYNFEGDICLPIFIKVVVASCVVGAVFKYGQEFIAKKVTDPLKGKPEKQMKIDDAVEKALAKFMPRLEPAKA